jgi:hypothetical protein
MKASKADIWVLQHRWHIRIIGVGIAMLALLILGIITHAHAAQVSYDDHILRFSGEIQPGDDSQVTDLIGNSTFDGKKIIVVGLNSDGGDIYTGVKIAQYLLVLEKAGWQVITIVMDGNVCASSCVTIYAAGSIRVLERHNGPERRLDGKLIVHSAVSTATNEEDDTAMASTLKWVRLLKTFGAPDSVVAKLADTSSRAGLILDSDDMKAWNVRWVRFDGKTNKFEFTK